MRRSAAAGAAGAGRLALGVLLLGALAGCQQLAMLPKVDVVQPSAALPLGEAQAAAAPEAKPATGPAAQPPAPPRRPSGAIFQADRYRPLFENYRARLVGDTVTVAIVEKVSAVQSSTSTIDRSGSVSAGVTAIPLLPSTALNRLSATGSDANSFAGKGTVQNSNDFSGTITATVVQVLPNGHLIVSAEKQIGVNANVDVLRFSGQVDPQSIAPGNSVQSTAIANVRIEQRGRGQQAEAQSMGWLSRFFLNVLPI